MRKVLIPCLVFLSLVLGIHGYSQTQPPPDQIESEVFKVLDEFDRAFNAKEPVAWERTFNFPHYRLVGDQLLTFDKAVRINNSTRLM